jgi:hypothetical protein
MEYLNDFYFLKPVKLPDSFYLLISSFLLLGETLKVAPSLVLSQLVNPLQNNFPVIGSQFVIYQLSNGVEKSKIVPH